MRTTKMTKRLAARIHVRSSRVGALFMAVGVFGLSSGAMIVPRSAPRKDSYVGTFTDFDLFLHAIAADLVTYRQLTHRPPSPVLNEMEDVALKMYQKGIIATPGGGWIFQPGGWDDHPDYKYTGYDRKAANLTPRPEHDMATDISHFSRFPLWLNSERLASQGARSAYYGQLEAGLCREFFGAVAVPPAQGSRVYLFTNFMDGRNGLYRLGYLQRGAVWGYGPYELSSSVFMGWWAPLGLPAARMYAQLRDGFPYSDSEIARMTGPSPVQPFHDGTYQLLTTLAARVAGGPAASSTEVATEDREWERALAPTLTRSIWSGGDAESAQYPLMMPLHVAFMEHRADWQKEFSAEFGRFVASHDTPPAVSLLGKLHYMYFATRFLVLAAQSGDTTLVPSGLADFIEAQVTSLWQGSNQVISQVGWGEPRYTDFRSYEAWKLALPRTYVLPGTIRALPKSAIAGCTVPRPVVAAPAKS